MGVCDYLGERERLAAKGRHLGKQEREVALTPRRLVRALGAEVFEGRESLASGGEEAA